MILYWGNNHTGLPPNAKRVMVYSGKEDGHHGALGGQLWSKNMMPPLRGVCIIVCIHANMMHGSICLWCSNCVCALLCGFQKEARDFKAMKSSKAACFMGV